MCKIYQIFFPNTFFSNHFVELVFLKHALRNIVLVNCLLIFPVWPILKCSQSSVPHPNPSSTLLSTSYIHKKKILPKSPVQEPLLSGTNPFTHALNFESFSIQCVHFSDSPLSMRLCKVSRLNNVKGIHSFLLWTFCNQKKMYIFLSHDPTMPLLLSLPEEHFCGQGGIHNSVHLRHCW